jgi:hypothetical protein
MGSKVSPREYGEGRGHHQLLPPLVTGSPKGPYPPTTTLLACTHKDTSLKEAMTGVFQGVVRGGQHSHRQAWSYPCRETGTHVYHSWDKRQVRPE